MGVLGSNYRFNSVSARCQNSRKAERRASLGVLAAFFTVLSSFVSAERPFFELPPLEYSRKATSEEVEALREKWSREGAANLAGKALLREVLAELNVPESSQVLVFSKTSLQNGLISRRNPRALYFSDDVYVGWVPGGMIELIVESGKHGPVFYTVEANPKANAPTITRATSDCLSCHAGGRTGGVPGVLVRSVHVGEDSFPIFRHGTETVDDRTPLERRWGGWYVTGGEGVLHLGNQLASKVKGLVPMAVTIDTVGEDVPPGRYLRDTSSAVALMVLEHQCRVHNVITEAKMRFRRSAHVEDLLQEGELGGSPSRILQDRVRVASAKIVDALLFKGEAPLPGEGLGVKGEFAQEFQDRGPKIGKRKSLRRLRMYERMFRYRCSYMIYSRAFDTLPKVLKEAVFVKLRAAVSEEGLEGYDYLTAREKRAISQLLSVTCQVFRAVSADDQK